MYFYTLYLTVRISFHVFSSKFHEGLTTLILWELPDGVFTGTIYNPIEMTVYSELEEIILLIGLQLFLKAMLSFKSQQGYWNSFFNSFSPNSGNDPLGRHVRTMVTRDRLKQVNKYLPRAGPPTKSLLGLILWLHPINPQTNVFSEHVAT